MLLLLNIYKRNLYISSYLYIYIFTTYVRQLRTVSQFKWPIVYVRVCVSTTERTLSLSSGCTLYYILFIIKKNLYIKFIYLRMSDIKVRDISFSNQSLAMMNSDNDSDSEDANFDKCVIKIKDTILCYCY